MTPTVHPFPARMAPELALQTLAELSPDSIVLDPMAGSGTVLRQASDLGLKSVGFDLDPLAVLMSRVWTSPVDLRLVNDVYTRVRKAALALDPLDTILPWIDDDAETLSFVRYWFGYHQRRELRCWSFALWLFGQENAGHDEALAVDIIRIAMSRIIVTKEQCASLARDTSHSRPHRVALTSNYSVFAGLEKSLKTVCQRLSTFPPKGGADVYLGDARSLTLKDQSVTSVLTSPPYLNAIDYMRGHRMSLVWLGYSLSSLRGIRSSSIGAERAPESDAMPSSIKEAFGPLDGLPRRHLRMIDRYAIDLGNMVREIRRVLTFDGTATFVVGNSCLQGVFVNNSRAVEAAAVQVGMRVMRRSERDLPSDSRYLPTSAGSPLQKRMRTETIITLAC